jgi:hypothetical protein
MTQPLPAGNVSVMPFPAFFAGPAVAARLSPGYNQQVPSNEVPSYNFGI